MALDKLGPHALANTEPVRRWAAQAPIVKGAFDGGVDVVRAAKAANPSVITVYRPKWMLRTDSGQLAAQEVIEFYRSKGFIPDYTELWNEGDEIGQRLGNGLERRLQLHQEAVGILNAAGIQVAGFSFSERNPGPDDIAFLAANGWGGVQALALHEYWFGPPPFPREGTLRYRQIREWAGGNTPPIIITECGRHYAGPNDWGWEKTELAGNPQGYVNELAVYAGELARDGYMIGGCVFTNDYPGGDWDNRGFNTDPLVDYILDGVSFKPPPTVVGLAVGLLLGGAAVALLALDLAGVTGEIAVGPVRRQFMGPEIVEVPALELEPGQPIPPGYEVVG